MKEKPKKCRYPDCFHCVYKDCRWDSLTKEDFTETNNRDYFLYEDSTGRKYHKGTDAEYRYQRKLAYERERRETGELHEYNQKYYAQHREEICKKKRELYDTEINTKRCQRYRKQHIERRREYDKLYYEKNREKKKQRALERYYERKAAANA